MIIFLITGEKSKKETSGYVSKKTDWLVGRGGNQPEEPVQEKKSASVRRSESVHVTSTSKLTLKPVLKQSGASSTRNTTQMVQENGSNKDVTKQQEVQSQDTIVSRKIDTEDLGMPKATSNITGKTSPLNITSSNKMADMSSLQSSTEPQKSHTHLDSSDSQKTPQKKQILVKKDTSAAKTNDPPWKNVSLRRTESARVTNYSREKPLTWKREEADKTVPTIVVENADSTAEKPTGWRPVVMDPGAEKKTVNLRRCESARVQNKNNIDIISKFLSNSQDKEKRDMNDNKIVSMETPPPKDSAVTKLKSETTGLNRSQSMRMLFENMEAKKNMTPAPSPVAAVQRREQGLRRTSSLKVLPGEMESFRAEHKAKVSIWLQLIQAERRVCFQTPPSPFSPYLVCVTCISHGALSGGVKNHIGENIYMSYNLRVLPCTSKPFKPVATALNYIFLFQLLRSYKWHPINKLRHYCPINSNSASVFDPLQASKQAFCDEMCSICLVLSPGTAVDRCMYIYFLFTW